LVVYEIRRHVWERHEAGVPNDMLDSNEADLPDGTIADDDTCEGISKRIKGRGRKTSI
jgi:hypothetical protein